VIQKTFKITLGIVLVIIGLIGGLIPVFQGWILGIPGLILLAEYFPPVKRLLSWAKVKAGMK
jgi:4-hydroxybenzoate polyprenyltransferase